MRFMSSPLPRKRARLSSIGNSHSPLYLENANTSKDASGNPSPEENPSGHTILLLFQQIQHGTVMSDPIFSPMYQNTLESTIASDPSLSKPIEFVFRFPVPSPLTLAPLLPSFPSHDTASFITPEYFISLYALSTSAILTCDMKSQLVSSQVILCLSNLAQILSRWCNSPMNIQKTF